jgi:TPR repeat protein
MLARKSEIKAVEQGDALAQLQMGNEYALGEHVAKDLGEALKLWRKSAAQGCPKAQRVLGLAYSDGSLGLHVDRDEAIRWSRKAAKQGDAEAQNFFGDGPFAVSASAA